MLNFIREQKDSWIIKSILWLIVTAFIATIFYSWGMGGASTARGGVVATVAGEPINFNEYNQTFENMVRFYRQQFRDQFTEEMIQRLDLKTQAIDALIQKKILLVEAKKQGIIVTNEELAETLKTFPSFQRDGKFNTSVYNNYLKFNRLTPLQFEEGQRESLIIDKVQRLIQSAAKVSEAETMEIFKRESEKFKLDYVAVFDDKFETKFEVSEDELKAHYDKNKNDFKTQEKFKAQYVLLDGKSYESEIVPDEKETENYYNAKIATYSVKKKYKARHILFRLDPKVADESATIKEKQEAADKAAKARAEDVLKKIESGEFNFEDAAKKFSEDKVSGEKGGDLGEFEAGVMVPEFEREIDKLEINKISKVIRTPFGYHIAQLLEKTPGRTKPLSEVKDDVVQSLKAIKANQKIRRTARRIQNEAQANKDLVQAAKTQGVEVKTTDYFTRRDHILPEIGNAPQFYEQAFILKDDQISEPINTPERSYVLKVIERVAPTIPALDAIKEDVRAAVLRVKNKEHAKAKFKELSAQFAKDKDLEKLATELKTETKVTPLFSMVDSIPGIGNVQNVKDAIANLQKGDTTSVSAVRRFFFIKINEREPAGTPSKEEYDKIALQLKSEKGQTLFQDWMDDKKERTEILINQEIL